MKYVTMLMTSGWFAYYKWGYGSSYVYCTSDFERGLWVVSYVVILNELKHVRYELWLCLMLLMVMNFSVILWYGLVVYSLNVHYGFKFYFMLRACIRPFWGQVRHVTTWVCSRVVTSADWN